MADTWSRNGPDPHNPVLRDVVAARGDQWPEEANVGSTRVDKFGRVRQPAVMFVDDDDRRTHGHAAIRKARQHSERVERRRQAARQRMTPAQRARYDYLRVAPRHVRLMALRAWRGSTRSTVSVTTAKRAREYRPSAARRTSSSSRTSSADPPGGASEPAEPPARRLRLVEPAPPRPRPIAYAIDYLVDVLADQRSRRAA